MNRILVIDDDEDIRALLEISLKKWKYQVDAVQDASSAQKYLAGNVPDLILMDVMMPDMSGLELCAWVRSQPATKDVPIIQVSALGDETTVQDSLETGAMDYVIKPINFDVLQRKIKLALQRNHLRKKEGQTKT
jgi:DNA-binding response OmpR family regulator